MADRIFEGRLRVVSIGELCELRLEESGRYGTSLLLHAALYSTCQSSGKDRILDVSRE